MILQLRLFVQIPRRFKISSKYKHIWSYNVYLLDWKGTYKDFVHVSLYNYKKYLNDKIKEKADIQKLKDDLENGKLI